MAMKLIQQDAAVSKQMVYGVYENVVSKLNEYEAMTQKDRVERSTIESPDRSRKSVDDVQTDVQTQLLFFETQQKECPKEISASVNKELRNRTIHLAAVRAEHKMKLSDTDKYICQLYEILAKGTTKHDIRDKPWQPICAETIRVSLQHIFKGNKDASKIDQQFKNDETKKAITLETHRCELDDSHRLGVLRMVETMPELFGVLSNDLEEFESDGPSNLK